jgi:hypothetical protein
VETYSNYVLRVSLSLAAGMLTCAAIQADHEHSEAMSHKAGSEEFIANYEDDNPGAHGLSIPPEVTSVTGGLLMGGATYLLLTRISNRRRRREEVAVETDEDFENSQIPESTPWMDIGKLRERPATVVKTLRHADPMGKLSTWIVRPEITINEALDSPWNEHLLDEAQYALKERRFNELYPDEVLQ